MVVGVKSRRRFVNYFMAGSFLFEGVDDSNVILAINSVLAFRRKCGRVLPFL